MARVPLKLGLTLLALGAALPAFACDFCERKVTLTPELATCYLSKVDAEIAQMEQSGLPAQLINLASCEGAQSATRGGTALPQGTEAGQEPSLSFVLDAPALRCLAASLKTESWSPELVKTFEVRRDCETQ
jgi:hypothetical protein